MRLFLFTLLLLIARISNAQNVGIGVNSPTRAKLEVHGAVDATSAIFGGESRGISLQRNWPGIGFNTYYNSGNIYIANGYASKFYQDPDNGHMFLDIYGNGTAGFIVGTANRAFTIAPNGFLGIGSGTPNGHMQFGNTITNRKIVLWETANNSHQFFGFGIGSGTLRYQVAGTGDAHRFYAGSPTASTLLMTLQGDKTLLLGDGGDNAAKMGINFPNPVHALSIRQTDVVSGGKGILLQEVLNNTTWEINAGVGGGGSLLRLANNGTNVGYFESNGDYNTFSDARLKTNVEVMPAVLARLLQLRPVSYMMKENNPDHKVSIGFIAQEVGAVFPEMVSVTENFDDKIDGLKNVHALNYSSFGVIAIKAIQELQLEIEALKKELNELKMRVR